MRTAAKRLISTSISARIAAAKSFSMSRKSTAKANVAQIGTFGTLAARAAIRDVGRALGMPISRVDQIVAMVPDQLNISLDEALEQSADLKKAYQTDGEIRELIDLAMKIEGLARNVGTHAAAVVIAEKPLDRIRAAAAACKAKTKSSRSGRWATSSGPAC